MKGEDRVSQLYGEWVVRAAWFGFLMGFGMAALLATWLLAPVGHQPFWTVLLVLAAGIALGLVVIAWGLTLRTRTRMDQEMARRSAEAWADRALELTRQGV